MTSTRELFRQHSLRCTRQRMSVYETLRDCKCHPTAEELFRRVRPTTEKLSLATVYNALEAFSEAGLVRRMPTSNGCCRYDADVSPHVHVRVCDTSEIEDVPPELSRKLLDRIPQAILDEIGRKLGVHIDARSIQLLAMRNDGN